MKYLIIKDNYVIDVILWDGVTPYTYPFPHDLLLLDAEESVSIGDYYDSTDDTFWKQVGSLNPELENGGSENADTNI